MSSTKTATKKKPTTKKKPPAKKRNNSGGARAGAGRPPIITGERINVTVLLGKAHWNVLNRIKRENSLNNISEALRWLLEGDKNFKGKRVTRTTNK